ncbi:sister chromatid cohesion 1 protein 3 isoform X2 [Benincasa hispida]|uniref:sister chromatid cohesion 1 protein 3 isoform X2 n=1 Tax=Benincasa hispida TaxID=102211 RepID=UPI001900CE5B|nr:sister chromatid cohesion 1 protein 3 isoform X2 [Benincasa hispida]
MFYSHTLLARKTPLGTVWCAAHLQHRLNKKDYEKTKIPIVVDAIMFGEVPLALRTSSYLLLGVVRIYSKQIDYLKHDVDVLVMELRKMYMHASAKLTLPENAYQAPFHSITLPETFDLDALELDGDTYHDGVPDTHLRSLEEITLADQISVGRDTYVDISFDEDVMQDLSHLGESPDLGIQSMEDDVIPPPHVDTTINVEVPSVNEDVLNMTLDEDNMAQSFPEVEVPDPMYVQDFGLSNQSMREVDDSPENVREREGLQEDVPDFITKDVPTVSPLGKDAMTEPQSLIDENINQEDLLPIMEEKTTLPSTSLPYEQSAGPPTSASPPEAFKQSSVEHVLQPTPPQQPRPRSRKRKQFFDKSTVLTNKFMKEALEDSSDLLRERRNIPSSSLEIWKLNNKLKKENVFYHPSITGLCHDLSDIFNVSYIASKCRTTSLEEHFRDHGDTRNIASTSETFFGEADAPSPAPEDASTSHTGIPTTDVPVGNIPSAGVTFLPSVVASSLAREAASSPHPRIPPTVDPASASFSDMEIEHCRDVEGSRGDDTLADLVVPPTRFMPSPRPSEGLGSPSLIISSTGRLSTPGSVSTEPSRSMFETPGTADEGLDALNLTLSGIPEQISTADEDLYFLEADSSPTGSQGTHGVDSLSVRTRAVGRYLRSLSPIKSISNDSTQDLSLNGILEGKRRKLCARMFYEILVLKSYGLIDVQQDVPYGDITLKLTPKLSMP